MSPYLGKTVLITGSSGFIGSNLSRKLKTLGANVIGIDNAKESTSESVLNIDISKYKALEKVFQENSFDYIFHLAAHFANQNSVDHPIADINTNILGTLNLLKLISKYSLGSRVFFSSSSCVYGSGKEGFKEDIHSDYLATPYAINKLTAEYYCKFYSENFGVSPIVIGRYFNVFGPGDVPGKYRNVIPNFISRILEDKEIVCYGDGSDTRSYSYIDDIVNMTLFVTSNCSSKYEVINLGDHHYEKSILEIISCIERSINIKAKITYLPVREWEDCKNRSCDNTKLLNIGFNDWSSKSFDEKIDETVEFIKGL